MIKLVPSPTFDEVVRLTVPGEAEPCEVTLTFQYMTAEQSADWFKTSAEMPIGEAVAKIVSGWAGVEDEAGKPVPYTAAALKQLLMSYQPASLEIVRAWQQGLTASRIKN